MEGMQGMLLQLAAIFTPLVTSIVKKLQGSNGQFPTDEAIRAELMANIDTYLGEGAQWKTKHPLQG